MDVKFIFFLISLVINWGAFIPYFRGVFKGEVKPHAYTWLIWTLTVGITTAGVWYGGGGYPVIGLLGGAALCFFVFLLSFRYGTKRIKVSDTVALFAALAAIAVWVFLDEPFLSVLLATAIDTIAYWPSIRKTYVAPWSEPLTSWALFTLGSMFSILALASYTPLTLTYYVVTATCNALLIGLFLIRRTMVPKPVA